MKLTAEQIEGYRSNGYLHVPGVFSQAQTDALRQLVYRLYRRFRSAEETWMDSPAPWREQGFDDAMIALRSSSPREFGALYDCAQSSLELVRFVTDPRLARIAADCLEDDAQDLSFSGLMLRMDPPKDNRNAIDWHQDRSYYPQNDNGEHGVVVTVALQDIAADSGALKICPGSHRAGLVAPVQRIKDDYETTEQRSVPMEEVARCAQIDAEIACGDVLVMSLNLFHRSGSNMQGHIRYSALCRYHRVMAADYAPFGLIYQFNDYMLETR